MFNFRLKLRKTHSWLYLLTVTTMYIVHCPHLVRAVFVELAQVPSCAKGQGSSAPHRRAPTPATPQAACRRRPVLERAPFDDPPRTIARGTFSASSMPNVDIEVSFQSARLDLHASIMGVAESSIRSGTSSRSGAVSRSARTAHWTHASVAAAQSA